MVHLEKSSILLIMSVLSKDKQALGSVTIAQENSLSS